MRILKFIVEGQTLRKDPECDFSHIIKGSKDYLGCSFKLPADWRNIPLAATFTHYGKEICASPVFSGACLVDNSVTDYKNFKISLTAIKNGEIVRTNAVKIWQEEG